MIIGQLFVSLVFAALVSRIPLAGYSYQWVSRLANPKIGWIIGWISFTFLIVDVVAVDYAVASTVLPSLFNYTETNQNAWLATGIVIVVQMVLIIFSTLWSTRINWAMSRDQRFPGYQLFRQVDMHTGTPLYADFSSSAGTVK